MCELLLVCIPKFQNMNIEYQSIAIKPKQIQILFLGLIAQPYF